MGYGEKKVQVKYIHATHKKKLYSKSSVQNSADMYHRCNKVIKHLGYSLVKMVQLCQEKLTKA